ncbi:MAG: NAD+ synthase [Wolinella sp.]
MKIQNPAVLANELVRFLRDELKTRGFTKAILGLSGGLDSAVVSVLAKEAYGENLKCVFMPSSHSARESLEHARLLEREFKIPLCIRSIAPFEVAFMENLKDEIPNQEENPKLDSLLRHRIGNACARFRMILLFDIAFAENRLVIGTSNKSELLLGYTTLYGDMACAFNPIGDLYKTEIFQLANFLKLPREIIEKAPSADLFSGQSDEAELGFSYNDIDRVLHDYVECNIDSDGLLSKGYSKEMINSILSRTINNQFKRVMPPLASVRGLLN